MFYFVMICLQLLFCFFLFMYFKGRMEKILAGQKLKDELDQVIISFNQHADRNLGLLEDKMSAVRKLTGDVDKCMRKHQEKAFYNADTEPVEEKREPASPPKPALRKNKPSVQKKAAVKKPVPKAAPKPDGVIDYFIRQEEKNFDDIPLPQQVRLLKQKKYSDKKIAKELNLSISEIQLVLDSISAN